MPTFRTFFHGKMSGLEVTCLKSFLDHGHRIIVFAYDDTEIPSLFERADAATVLPRERVFFYKSGPGAGSVAGFSNLFRYTLLKRYGDWWTDTDVLSGEVARPALRERGLRTDNMAPISCQALE